MAAPSARSSPAVLITGGGGTLYGARMVSYDITAFFGAKLQSNYIHDEPLIVVPTIWTRWTRKAKGPRWDSNSYRTTRYSHPSRQALADPRQIHPTGTSNFPYPNRGAKRQWPWPSVFLGRAPCRFGPVL